MFLRYLNGSMLKSWMGKRSFGFITNAQLHLITDLIQNTHTQCKCQTFAHVICICKSVLQIGECRSSSTDCSTNVESGQIKSKILNWLCPNDRMPCGQPFEKHDNHYDDERNFCAWAILPASMFTWQKCWVQRVTVQMRGFHFWEPKTKTTSAAAAAGAGAV